MAFTDEQFAWAEQHRAVALSRHRVRVEDKGGKQGQQTPVQREAESLSELAVGEVVRLRVNKFNEDFGNFDAVVQSIGSAAGYTPKSNQLIKVRMLAGPKEDKFKSVDVSQVMCRASLVGGVEKGASSGVARGVVGGVRWWC